MYRSMLAIVIGIMLLPQAALALCGDGKIDEAKGEQCDTASKQPNKGCERDRICAPNICQCVFDYGGRSPRPATVKKKVKIKK
jgi:hypothetical protein